MTQLIGVNGDAVPGGIDLNTSTQEYPLGMRAESLDGRIFRYCKAGATALVPGKLYDSAASVANHTNIAVAATAAIGAKQVTVTLGATAATANQYSGGTLTVNDETGQGYTYLIDKHPAADASASLVITLEDPLIVALDTTSQVSLLANPYSGVIIHATTETGNPAGVAVRAITATYYGWVLVTGVQGCLVNDTTAIGQSVAASDTTNAGGVEIGDGVLPVVGYAPVAGVSTEYNPIYFNIG